MYYTSEPRPPRRRSARNRFPLVVAALAAISVAFPVSAAAFELNAQGYSHLCWFSEDPASDWYKVAGSEFHAGDDIYADDWNRQGGVSLDCGEPVLPSCEGEVIYAGDVSNGYGNQVVIQCAADPGFAVRVAHLEGIHVSVGQFVTHADTIGTVGATGAASCHLHLVLYKNIFDASAVEGETGLSRLRQGRAPNGALAGPASRFAAMFDPDDHSC